jgi:hypothetical protein
MTVTNNVTLILNYQPQIAFSPDMTNGVDKGEATVYIELQSIKKTK